MKPIHPIRVMERFVRRQRKQAGSEPGTLVHTGPQRMAQVAISSVDYDADELRDRTLANIDDAWPLREGAAVTWVNIDGLHDVGLIRRFGERFGIHPLVLEDITSVGQRPKLEEYDGMLFVVLSLLDWDEEHGEIHAEQLSLLVGQAFVFTFREQASDVFAPVVERLRQAHGRLRGAGSDFLAYALIDAAVDRYYHVLEHVGAAAEELETEALTDPTHATMERLHRLRRELVVLRRAVWPLRDVAGGLLRSESAVVTAQTRVFLRDVYDHVTQMIDTAESLRDVVSGAIDLYLSNIANRTNEVMKVLTIMASIFIPLTFLAGVYGMNFRYMPELGLRWAYPALLGGMAAIAGGMVLYFRRKGWL